MGQLITTVVGGVVGFLIGGPMGAAIGMSLGGMVGATLFGPTIKGPRLNDLKVTSSTYGIAIPEIYGTTRVSGNLIWTTGIKETKHTRRAGKGGPKVTTYTYDATFAVGLCKGPITSILRVWADSKLIYDRSNNSTRNPLPVVNNGITGPTFLSFIANKKDKKKNLMMRVYRGTEDQLPDSLMEADKGAGNVSAHRGLAYVVFERMQLADFGNRIPQLTFEISKSPAESFPSVTVKDGPGGVVTSYNRRDWFPDWENGRLFSSVIGGPNETDVFNLDTMSLSQKLYGFNVSGGWRYAFAPHVNLFLRQETSRNSGPIALHDLSTMARIAAYGRWSNSLSGFYIEYGPDSPDLCLGAAFSNQVGVPLDGSKIVLVTVWGDAWILSMGGKPLGFYAPDWVPKYMMPALGSVWGWRNGNGGLQIADFISSGIGGYTYKTDYMGNVYWVQGGGLAYNTTLRPIAGETYTSHVTLFDPSDGCFFSMGLSSNGVRELPVVLKYNPIAGIYKFIRTHEGMRFPYTLLSNMEWSRLNGGTFGWIFTQYRQVGKVNQIDLQNGDWIRDTAFGNLWGDQIYFSDDQHWDDVSSSLIIRTATAYRRIYFNNTVAAIRLSDVVKDIATKSGVLTEEDIDVSSLVDQEIIGFAIDRQSSAKDALKLLATGYMFDAYESDYKLKFRTRGEDSAVIIPKDWIARRDGEAIKENVTQELEMPLKVTVNYYDTKRDHQQGSQSARRNAGPFPTMWTAKQDVIDLPIVWTPDMAKRSADKLLKMAWANRTGLQFTLPWRYLKYDPSDVATITTDKAVYLVRLTDLRIGQDFSIESSAVTEKGAAYISTKLGSGEDIPSQIITGSHPAFPIVVNTPLLRDADYDTSGKSVCYVTAGTYALSFNGAAIYVDDGIEALAIGNVGKDTVTGTVINQLPYTTAYESTDERTALYVRLTNQDDELESVTQLDMLNFDLNAALVGQEIIQFRDAVQQESGEWRLTGIRRARRGTNYAIGTHIPGEKFVLLDAEALAAFGRTPESYVTTRSFRAVVDGQDLDEATEVFADLVPRDLMPYTPEDVKISDDGTTVTISVQRRSRITAPLRDGTSAIHFKEGSKHTARITCKVWPGKTVKDAETANPPAFVESVPIFDSTGQDVPLAITFPLTSLGGENKFLARLTETGVVDGIPKWVAFERLSENRWNRTDFY